MSTAPLSYLKVEGIGNDFLLVDRLDGDEAALRAELEGLAARAPSLCDRKHGIGADGLLVVTQAEGEAVARMIVINHDGSRPEMCGNGLRCVAHWLAERLELREAFEVETDAGALRCELLSTTGDGRAEVGVDMGPAKIGEREHPAAAGERSFLSVSMGNPHAIAFVDDEDPEALARELGPSIETDPAYPQRTNVEFARIDADGGITLWVWERGCGITLACGTGACATAAAAVREGRLPAEQWIPLRLPGGELQIWVPRDPSASVRMRGPSLHLAAGEA